MRRVMLARCSRIERAVARAVEEQYATLNRLLARGRYTHFGQYEGLKHVRTPEQFARVVRRFDYASFAGYVERMRGGERDVTTAGRVEMFARSSGTSARSKYIPLRFVPYGIIICEVWPIRWHSIWPRTPRRTCSMVVR